jgi:integrase
MLHLCIHQKKCLLLEAAQLFQAHQPPLRGFPFDANLSAVIAQLIAAKRAANRTEDDLKSLAYYLETFAQGWEHRAIAEITFTKIEGRLATIAAGQSDSSRQTWFNRVNTLFSFAVRRGFITQNPFDRLERIFVDRKPPVILTPAQSRELLAATPTVMRPYLVLTMFAGIRPDGEAMKLCWEHINLETGRVAIDFPKVRKHRRVIQLEPIAVALLREHPIKKGHIAPSHSTVRRWKRKMRKIPGLAKWPADLLRHTAASYLLELRDDTASVARHMGNSVQILMAHYIVPVSPEDCAAFWSLGK